MHPDFCHTPPIEKRWRQGRKEAGEHFSTAKYEHFYTAIGTAPEKFNNSATRIQIHAECRRKKNIGEVSSMTNMTSMKDHRELVFMIL